MPAVNPSNDRWFEVKLTQFERRIRALETRPTFTVWNPAAGTPGGVVPVINLGQQADGTFSMKQWDGSGNTRLVVGQMPTSGVGSAYAGDYGILVADSKGTTQEVLPRYFQNGPSGFTTSTTFTKLSGQGSDLSVVIGASGDADITVSYEINLPNGSSQATVGVSLDNALALAWVVSENTGTNTPMFGTFSFRAPWSVMQGSTVTPGTHTFGLRFESGTGTNCGFPLGVLYVEPV